MAGARRMTMAVVALVACLALLVQVSSAAVSHVVGDATGWTKPPSSTFYNSWASNQPPFNIGDFLVFNFPGPSQTVAEVKKPAYDKCSAAAPITQMNNGPVNITITTPGTHYYISTDSGHCFAGQKFAITYSRQRQSSASHCHHPSRNQALPRRTCAQILHPKHTFRRHDSGGFTGRKRLHGSFHNPNHTVDRRYDSGGFTGWKRLHGSLHHPNHAVDRRYDSGGIAGRERRHDSSGHPHGSSSFTSHVSDDCSGRRRPCS